MRRAISRHRFTGSNSPSFRIKQLLGEARIAEVVHEDLTRDLVLTDWLFFRPAGSESPTVRLRPGCSSSSPSPRHEHPRLLELAMFTSQALDLFLHFRVVNFFAATFFFTGVHLLAKIVELIRGCQGKSRGALVADPPVPTSVVVHNVEHDSGTAESTIPVECVAPKGSRLHEPRACRCLFAYIPVWRIRGSRGLLKRSWSQEVTQPIC